MKYKINKNKLFPMLLGLIAQLVVSNSSETIGLGVIVYFLIQIYYTLVEE